MGAPTYTNEFLGRVGVQTQSRHRNRRRRAHGSNVLKGAHFMYQLHRGKVAKFTSLSHGGVAVAVLGLDGGRDSVFIELLAFP